MYQEWMRIKEQIRKLTEELHEVEANIWEVAHARGNINPSGSKTFHERGFKITIGHANTYKVDQSMASAHPALFKKEFKFDKKFYNEASPDLKELIDECVTITPNKPAFKVEMEDGV